MVTPTRSQRFWARGRPWQLWFLIVPVLFSVAYLGYYEITPGVFLQWPGGLWAILSAVLGWVAGLFMATVVGWMVVGAAQHGQVVLNGGPFKVGDTVQVITGRFAGRVGRIYCTGPYEMVYVYVDLGPEAKHRHEDLFSQIKLLKVRSAEGDIAADDGAADTR